jgi:5-methylcytosine-specific restriction endonuclease McrA
MGLDLTDDQRREIFDSTGGLCHLCHRRVAWKNYGLHGKRGGWEFDHSVARANGGTDRVNNLRPAHTKCNRERQDLTVRAYRERHGVRGLPPSLEQARAAAAWSVLPTVALVVLAAGVIVWALSRVMRLPEPA